MAKSRLVLLALLASSLAGQTLTTVSGTVRDAAGNLVTGTLTVDPISFLSVDGDRVAQGPISSNITAGVLSIDLAPNVGATPSGTSYSIRIMSSDRRYRSIGTWIVPDTGTATLSAVWQSSAPIPTTQLQLSSVLANCTDAQVVGGNSGATGIECQADDDVPEIGDLGVIDTEAELEALVTDVTNFLIAAELNTVAELQALIADATLVTTTTDDDVPEATDFSASPVLDGSGNADILGQTEETDPADADVFLMETSGGAMRRVTAANLPGSGGVDWSSTTEVTISSGTFGVPAGGGALTCDTEADASTDTVTAITCAAGDRFAVRPESDARTCVFEHSASLQLLFAADFSLDDDGDWLQGNCPSTDTAVVDDVLDENGALELGGSSAMRFPEVTVSAPTQTDEHGFGFNTDGRLTSHKEGETDARKYGVVLSHATACTDYDSLPWLTNGDRCYQESDNTSWCFEGAGFVSCGGGAAGATTVEGPRMEYGRWDGSAQELWNYHSAANIPMTGSSAWGFARAEMADGTDWTTRALQFVVPSAADGTTIELILELWWDSGSTGDLVGDLRGKCYAGDEPFGESISGFTAEVDDQTTTPPATPFRKMSRSTWDINSFADPGETCLVVWDFPRLTNPGGLDTHTGIVVILAAWPRYSQ